MPDKKLPIAASSRATPVEGIGIRRPDFEVEPDTGVHSIDTPVGLNIINDHDMDSRLIDAAKREADQRLSNRVKETNARVASIETTGAKTFTGVDTLRTEMVEHVSSLRSEIGGVRSDLGEFKTTVGEKIDTLGEHVMTAMSSVNTAVTALNNFQGIVVEDRLETHRAYASIDVNKKILDDDAHADKKKLKRGVWYELGKKAGVVVLGLLGIIATAYITHRIEH